MDTKIQPEKLSDSTIVFGVHFGVHSSAVPVQPHYSTRASETGDHVGALESIQCRRLPDSAPRAANSWGGDVVAQRSYSYYIVSQSDSASRTNYLNEHRYS